MKLILCLTLVMAMAVAVSSFYEDQHEIAHTLCGRQLENARKLICSAGEEDYDEYSRKKRSIGIPLLNGWSGHKKSEDVMALVRVLSTPTKRVPALIEECCRRPCRLSELLNYC